MIAAGGAAVTEVSRLENVDIDLESGGFREPEQEVGEEGARRPAADDRDPIAIVQLQAALGTARRRSQAVGYGRMLRKASHWNTPQQRTSIIGDRTRLNELFDAAECYSTRHASSCS
jgi:hypothetical protein